MHWLAQIQDKASILNAEVLSWHGEVSHSCLQGQPILSQAHRQRGEVGQVLGQMSRSVTPQVLHDKHRGRQVGRQAG